MTLAKRLDDWETWYHANAVRLALYYQRAKDPERRRDDTNRLRLAFTKTMLGGTIELCGLAIHDALDRGQERDERHIMPREVLQKLDETIGWYNENIATVHDPVQQWRFALRCQGEMLQILRLVDEELTRLAKASVVRPVFDDVVTYE